MAFLTGFLSFSVTIGIETASIGIVCAATDTIDIIFNFISLAILVDFDNYVFAALKNESFKELLEEGFVTKATIIRHTSSKKCSSTALSDEVDKATGEKRLLKIEFRKRACANKILFGIYKFLRTFYASIFFYFMPFASVIISALLPIFFRGKELDPPN